MKTLGLTGKNILVTGCQGYLGYYIMNALKSERAFPMGIDKYSSDDNPWHVFEVDIADKDAVNKCANGFNTRGVPIDGIINNAAVSFKGKNITADQFKKTLDINVAGTNNIISAFSPYLKSGTSVVNIASMYGVISPDFSIYDGNKDLYNSCAYGASKAAIIQMSKYYARLYGPRVRVNAVSPGGILQGHSNDFIEKYSKRVPMGRMANPSEIVDAILFLLSDMSSYITGINLPVMGGIEV